MRLFCANGFFPCKALPDTLKTNLSLTPDTTIRAMCGICGKIHFDVNQPVDPQLIRAMCAALAHRGPDDEGVFTGGHVALGHRRLSVIDVSPAGRQPLANEDGSLRVVMNGEIYNYRELREDLERNGHRFSSKTDTEVILHLYEDKGPSCLKHLRGMFAFALWDSRQGILFFARDRLGKKPLYYCMTREGFVFASELGALRVDPLVDAAVDPVALHLYLTYQYVPSPRTIYSSVKKLQPGHYGIYRNGTLSLRRYWNLSYREKTVYSSLEEYRDHFLEVFREAVRIRLRSDVPLGAFLSGGLDSTLVVAVMSSMAGMPVKSFSIGFAEEDYNELPYARAVARWFGTDHHECIVTPEIQDLLPKLVRQYGEPFADSSAVPTYYLARMTRQHVTVALSGDGGDECFAGYPRYPETVAGAMCQKVARYAGMGLMSRILDALPANSNPRSFVERVKRGARLLCSDVPHWYMRKISQFDNRAKLEIYSPQFSREVGDFDATDYIAALYAEADGRSVLDRLLHVDVLSYLPEDLLVKVDIASMAHALEVRCPFLDHEVMEFAASLPPGLKLRGRTTKYFLKRALGGIVPREILVRQKMGFGVPIDRWLRNELYGMAEDLLLDGTAAGRGYFKPSAVRQLLVEHRAGAANHCYRLWNLLWLELWHRIFIDRTISA